MYPSCIYHSIRNLKKSIVIGAGIAGLATSIRLAVKGYDVQVFEANAYPGGKLSSFQEGEYRFDAGPSLFTIPSLIDDLFHLCGENPEDHFSYQRVEDVCHYFWSDGTRFVMPSSRDEAIQCMASTFDEDPSALKKYLDRGQQKYELTNPIFIEKSLHKSSTYLTKQTVKALLSSHKMDLMTSLSEVNQSAFQNPKLVQLFNRFATYNGSSPYKTPGIMSMIPHLEMVLGTYFPKGGMQSITTALYQLAQRMGVKFSFNARVQEILTVDGKAQGVKVVGQEYVADVVVSNMDVFSTYKHMLPKAKAPTKILNQERSSSALIFYWGIRQSFGELGLHNIVFSNDYEEEFAQIFDKKQVSNDPTVYINISSKYEPSDAPDGCENWFVMINTPGDIGQDWEEIIERSRTNIIRKINEALDVDISGLIELESILDPRSIESKTQSHQGSLYGTASNNRYAAFLRHPNFSRRIKDLYFVGGSVHPGGGIPLCLNSAKIVDNLI